MRAWGLLLAGLLCACAGKPKTELPPEKESVQDAVASHVGDVSDCYTAALKRNSKLAGKLILEWEINPIGDPKNIKVVQSLEPKLDQCISKKLEGWAFDPPPDDKIAKVRYPFVFAPVQDPLAGVKTKQFETVATPPPTNFKKCPQIENEYAGLCVRDENTGECLLDEKQTGEMLQLLRASPKFELQYLAEIDRMLKNPKPTPEEAKAIVATLREDCWTEIHTRMWSSMFHTFKNVPTHSRRAEAKEVLGTRTTGLQVHSPTRLALAQDIAILEKAMEAGFIVPGPVAKKEFNNIKNSLKKVKEETFSAADSQNLVKVARKELKAVKPIRAQLKDWSKRHWKKF